MGSQLIKAAYFLDAQAASDRKLKPNEMRLLLWMALTALDSDGEPRYFASREASAIGLGSIVADAYPGGDGDSLDSLARASAFQRVKVATAGLVSKGYITRLVSGRTGRRATYRLNLKSIAAGTKVVPLESTRDVPLAGTSNVRGGVARAYPQGTSQEPQQDEERGRNHSKQAPHLWAVENAVTRPKFTA